MSSKTPNYCALEKHAEEVVHLGNIMALAYWDKATLLAKGSAPNRQKEMATVATLLHKLITAKEAGELITAALQEENALDQWQLANLRVIKKGYDEAHCITPDVQKEYSIATGECEFVWRTARKNNDYKQLVPYLDRVFKSIRTIAVAKGKHLNKKPYDALLDSYNPDFTSDAIRETYALLKAELPTLVQNIIAKQATEKIIPLTQGIEEATQKAIARRVITQMGFSLDHGRLDTSVHPFCGGTDDDVRLTTRYEAGNFLSGLTGAIHEAGHGLYQQNLPRAYRDQPVGAAYGLAFHESQSIIMERQACTSVAFIEFLAALLRDEFGLEGKEYSAQNLYQLLTRVTPSLIRVDADEVTYPLHVIMRFEIEEAIIDGSIGAKDLPALWHEKMGGYVGVTPTTDDMGCMQDIHWPAGKLGYFPAYTNGAIIASMLMKAVRKADPTIDTALKKGNFAGLNGYLTENLRQFGAMKTTPDLLKISTGHATIEPTIFMDYLREKYL